MSHDYNLEINYQIELYIIPPNKFKATLVFFNQIYIFINMSMGPI